MLLQLEAWGCSAHAQIAGHLARACGIPAILVKTLDLKWIEHDNRGDGRASGHVYVEVLVDGKPLLWNAQGGRLHRHYDPRSFSVTEGRQVIYDKGGPDLTRSSSPTTERNGRRRQGVSSRVPRDPPSDDSLPGMDRLENAAAMRRPFPDPRLAAPVKCATTPISARRWCILCKDVWPRGRLASAGAQSV